MRSLSSYNLECNPYLHAAPTLLIPALLLMLTGCASTPRQENFSEVISGTTIDFEMIWIDDGGFWLGRTEVIWDAYLQYCDFDEIDPQREGPDAVSRPSEPIVPYDRDWGFGRRPAVGMSRNAAERYCEWLSQRTGHSYRLPSEAEWELACGTDSPEPLTDYAWFADNSGDRTQRVGRRLPNQYGFYDMLGNLWEYCSDPFNPDEPERAVLRGGSWKDQSSEVTSASRLGFDYDWVLADPNVPSGVWWVPDGDHLGFRVLRDEDD